MADPAMLERFIGADPAPFSELLVQLSNADTTQRTQAEAAFVTLKERWPEAIVVRLIEIIKGGNTPDIRGFAATLLRQVPAPSLKLS